MKSTGIGLLVFGIILTVVGAILSFAVRVRTEGFNLNTGGMILLFAGVGVVLISLVIIFMGGRSSSTSQQSIQQTPTGQVRTEERVDNDPL